MLDYHFPDESELFLHQPYTDIARKASAERNRAEGALWGQAAAFLLRSFIIVSVLLVAGHWGLSRAEAQFQSDARR